MKKLIGILANLILVTCILLMVAALVAPSLLGFTLDNILSGSMEPAIQTGALIAMERVTSADIKIGDVIGYRVEGMDLPVCHRVVEIVDTEEEFGFITKGDANEGPDPDVVKPGAIIGRVVFDLPYVGYVARFIKTPLGFGLLLGLPAVIIVMGELKTIFTPKYGRRKRPRLIRKKFVQLPAYLVIILGLVLIGILWGIMGGQTQQKTLGSIADENIEANQPSYTSERMMQNKGRFPLIICLSSHDKTVSFSESYFRLRPGENNEVEIEGDSKDAVINTGCFFPLLPQEVLYKLFIWNPRIAPLVVAAVWLIPITLIAFIAVKVLLSPPMIAPRAKSMKEMLSYD
jgi:signal peptidase